MAFFIGRYERTIDEKHRVQMPSQLRASVDPEQDGTGWIVGLGEHRRTLSIFPTGAFKALAARMETEFLPGSESRRFEAQFYGLATPVEMDKQHRIVLPDHLLHKARLGAEVSLLGQKYHIEVWDRADLNRFMDIDWDGEDWPDWQGYLRMRPATSP